MNISKYKKQSRKKWKFIIALILLCILLALVSMGVGSISISVEQILRSLIGMEGGNNIVILKLRLPRILTALLVGAMLGSSGAVMQCVLKNPLASASTLGVSQGAAFGAAVGIVVFTGGTLESAATTAVISIDNPYIVTISSFVCAMFSTIVLISISKIKSNTNTTILILTGVALSSIFAAGSTMLQYFADETKMGAVVFWTFGNLGRTNYKEILILLTMLILSLLFFIYNRWNYNAMQGDITEAKSLGVNTELITLLSMAICALSASVAVAFVGIISFVGLIAPHLVKIIIGKDHRYLIIASAISGSIILCASDILSRIIFMPVILPIGAITSFFGAIVFLIIIFRGEKYGKN